MPMLLAMNEYWADHPPAHLLLAAYVGYKRPASGVNDTKDMEALIGALQAQ